MGLMSEMKTWWISQLLLSYIVIASGFIVNALMLLTYICIWPFHKSLYRKIVVHLGYAWWSQFTFMAQWWAGSECTLHLENPDDYKFIGKEHVIVTMNHKYEIDWLMAWVISERLQMLGGTKIYGKQSLKFVPLIGWAWTFTESIFLKRQWQLDKKTITKDLEYMCAYPDNYWITLLLFCEGTRFTEHKHKASMEVARQKCLPELQHHLLPRAKGFVLSVNGVKGKFSSILDLTIGFTKEGAKPTILNILNGKPVQAQIYVRRIPLQEVPTDTYENCADWLNKHYQIKDKVYDNFSKNGQYTIGTKCTVPRRYNDLVMWIFWALLCCLPLFYYLCHITMSGSVHLQLAAGITCLLMTVLVKKLIGVTEIRKSSEYGKQNREKVH